MVVLQVLAKLALQCTDNVLLTHYHTFNDCMSWVSSTLSYLCNVVCNVSYCGTPGAARFQ